MGFLLVPEGVGSLSKIAGGDGLVLYQCQRGLALYQSARKGLDGFLSVSEGVGSLSECPARIWTPYQGDWRRLGFLLEYLELDRYSIRALREEWFSITSSERSDSY
jgi:hypothetical protein